MKHKLNLNLKNKIKNINPNKKFLFLKYIILCLIVYVIVNLFLFAINYFAVFDISNIYLLLSVATSTIFSIFIDSKTVTVNCCPSAKACLIFSVIF